MKNKTANGGGSVVCGSVAACIRLVVSETQLTAEEDFLGKHDKIEKS